MLIRTSVLSFLSVIVLSSSAYAQFSAQDQCKDVLVNAVFNSTEINHDTYYRLSYLSDEKRDTEKKTNRMIISLLAFTG